ncbi:uncharacterized protein LOC107368002 [Tetranychus urticae]|uniref:uncharacterized protein LOC107368002 n=1 Tax=Tetranychus urticae TaxID=32264 RepID=UPI00077BD67E|nr:uncharacterized protein LOC107368002 [Tetranychus urticae]
MGCPKTIISFAIISIIISQTHSLVPDNYGNDSNDSDGIVQYFNDLQTNHSSTEPTKLINSHNKSQPNPDNHGNEDHSNHKANHRVTPHQHLKSVVNINNNNVNNSPSKHHAPANINQHSSGSGHNFTTNEQLISQMAGNQDPKKESLSHSFNHIISDSPYQFEYYDPDLPGVYDKNDKQCTFNDDYCPFGKAKIHKIRWDNHLKHLTKIHHRCENLFPTGPFRFHVCCETFEVMMISNLIEMAAKLLEKECPTCFGTYRRILCNMATSIVAEKIIQPLPGPERIKMISRELYKSDQKAHEMNPLNQHHHHPVHRTHHQEHKRSFDEDGSMKANKRIKICMDC